MSARTAIVNALVEAFKDIKIVNGYEVDLYDNVINKHKFWDEFNSWPAVSVVGGREDREYLPGNFKWGYFGVSIKIYVKKENPEEQLESLISDIERVINNNYRLVYGVSGGQQTADMTITSIVTDEGLLTPYGIGEVNVSIQYQVL